MRLLADFPRWLFLGALFYAPWVYGCTEPDAITGLNILLAAVLILWSLDLAVRGPQFRLPRVLCLLIVCILTLGWAMTLNASFLYDPFFNEAVPLPKKFPSMPGSVERALSMAAMLRTTLCLGSLLFVADLVRRPLWQLRLWWTLGLAGASVALLGLMEKVTGAPMIFWQPATPPVTTFFATYFYHANGGAFLNLVLPPIACLTLRSIGGGAAGGRILWITALIVVLAAEAVNTSRGAQIVALLLCAALFVWPARRLLAHIWRTDRRMSVVMLAFGVTVAGAIVLSIGLEAPIKHWHTSLQSAGFKNDSGRWLAAAAGLRAVPSAGWFGYGPGTFRVVFPYYSGYLGDRVYGLWKYQHQDYIQTAIEWGWVGAALWSATYFGGVLGAVRVYVLRVSTWTGRQRLMVCSAVLALAGTALHSLIDFPMQIPSLQLYCAVYLGICWSATNSDPQLTASQRHSANGGPQS